MNAPGIAPSTGSGMPRALHATNATNATYVRVQDPSGNPPVLDAAGAVDNRLTRGDVVEIRMPHHPPRRGRYEYTQRNGLIVVTLFSPRLGRLIHGIHVYHPKFVVPVGVTA